MPHIVFRNLEKNNFEKIVNELKETLPDIIGCPNHKITYNLIESYTLIDQKDSNLFTFVNISYIERPKDIQDKVALTLDTALRALGKDNIAINFTYLNKQAYYDNMEQKK
ncbi:MAG: DUF1904 family protein [Erysipelotrichales bacterium]